MRKIWCFDCQDKEPMVIRPAFCLVPVRNGHYETNIYGNIDNRLVGICEECLKNKNEFQRNNTKPVTHSSNIIHGSF